VLQVMTGVRWAWGLIRSAASAMEARLAAYLLLAVAVAAASVAIASGAGIMAVAARLHATLPREGEEGV
jgi:hypothetical protein